MTFLGCRRRRTDAAVSRVVDYIFFLSVIIIAYDCFFLLTRLSQLKIISIGEMLIQ